MGGVGGGGGGGGGGGEGERDNVGSGKGKITSQERRRSEWSVRGMRGRSRTKSVGKEGGEAGGVAKKEPSVVRTPHHHFARLPEVGFPWEPHYLLQRVDCHSLPLRVHYIDEGWPPF